MQYFFCVARLALLPFIFVLAMVEGCATAPTNVATHSLIPVGQSRPPPTGTRFARIGLVSMDDSGNLIYQCAAGSGWRCEAQTVRKDDPTYEARVEALGGLTPAQEQAYGEFVACEPSSFFATAKLVSDRKILVTFNVRDCGSIQDGGFYILPGTSDYNFALKLFSDLPTGTEVDLTREQVDRFNNSVNQEKRGKSPAAQDGQ